MFRNQVVVGASPPSALSDSPFLCRLLRLHSPPPPPQLLKLDSLCWKLSRSLPLSLLLLPPPSLTLCLLYKRDHSVPAAEALDQVSRLVPLSDVGDEEEAPESLVAKAVECGLRSFLLNNGWRCLQENCFVDSSFSPDEERRHLLAFTASVQLEKSGELLFLVRPDVIRFSRYQISDFVDSEKQQKFSNFEEIVVEDFTFATSSSILPSLSEGHVVGFRKVLDAEVDLATYEENWSIKHGLKLPSDYFINVQFASTSQTPASWFPSAFVIQGAGLSPAPQSVRISEVAKILQLFITHIEGWDFFNEGKLHIKGITSLGVSKLSTWTAASNSTQCGFTFQNYHASLTDLFTSSDFQTQKPASLRDFDKKVEVGAVEDSGILANNMPDAPTCLHQSVSSTSHNNNPVTVSGSPSNHCTGSEAIVPKFSKKVPKKAKETTVPTATDILDVSGRHAIRNIRRKGRKERKEPTLSSDTSIEVHTSSDPHMTIPIRTDEHISVFSNDLVAIPNAHSDNMLLQGALPGFKKKRASTRNKISSFVQDQGSEASCSQDKAKEANAGRLSQDGQIQEPGNALPVLRDMSNLPKGRRGPKTKGNNKEACGEICKRPSIRAKSDGDSQDAPKKKAKQQADSPSDSISKVIEHHKRGQLESVTVVDLKAFLGSRKAKVGGRKEELIQRVISILE